MIHVEGEQRLRTFAVFRDILYKPMDAETELDERQTPLVR
jgi:hypothetical protein